MSIFKLHWISHLGFSFMLSYKTNNILIRCLFRVTKYSNNYSHFSSLSRSNKLIKSAFELQMKIWHFQGIRVIGLGANLLTALWFDSYIPHKISETSLTSKISFMALNEYPICPEWLVELRESRIKGLKWLEYISGLLVPWSWS